jgi:hypothetical protein
VALLNYQQFCVKGPTWDELQQVVPFDFSSEYGFLKELESLHASYINRSEIQWSDSLALVYLYYFFATNVGKLKPLLDYLPLSFLEKISTYEFIDMGAGPGTYTCAWYAALKARNLQVSKKFTLVEKSLPMRALAAKVLHEFLPESLEASIYSSLEEARIQEQQDQKERPKIMFWGHALNEIGAKEASLLCLKTKPEVVMFLEPGTKQSFREASAMRSFLIQNGYEIHYPCPSSQACPMNETEDWCHQYVHLSFDPQVERLCQMAKKDRRNAPVIFHVYEKIQSERSPKVAERAVITQYGTGHKGMSSFKICSLLEGEQLSISYLEQLHRQMSKDEIRELKELLLGTPVELQDLKQIREGFWRARLLPNRQ